MYLAHYLVCTLYSEVMRLREWVRSRGRGELTRLMLLTGIAYATLHKLANDQNAARYKTAKKISKATGGSVSIAELCELPARAARRTKASCASPKLADART